MGPITLPECECIWRIALEAKLKEAEAKVAQLENAARRYCQAMRAMPYDEFAAEELCADLEALLEGTP
jgi:hypothetical protein